MSLADGNSSRFESGSIHGALDSNTAVLQCHANAEHSQKIQHGAFIESTELIAGTRRNVRPFGNDPIVFLHQVRGDILRSQEWKAFNDDVRLSATILARKANGFAPTPAACRFC